MPQVQFSVWKQGLVDRQTHSCRHDQLISTSNKLQLMAVEIRKDHTVALKIVTVEMQTILVTVEIQTNYSSVQN